MPSVNLRLTDEQHAELVEAGKRENRSLQREIVYRLFGRFNQAEPPAPDPSLRKQLTADGTQVIQADSQARDVQSRTIVPPPVQDMFKPDPKPERKKK